MLTLSKVVLGGCHSEDPSDYPSHRKEVNHVRNFFILIPGILTTSIVGIEYNEAALAPLDLVFNGEECPYSFSSIAPKHIRRPGRSSREGKE